MAEKQNDSTSAPIHKHLADIKPINDVKWTELKPTLLSKNNIPTVLDTMAQAVVGLVGYNPTEKISTNKDTKIKEFDFEKFNSYNHMPESFPLPQKKYFELLNCDKYIAKTSIIPNPTDSRSYEHRLLLIGKLGNDEYVSFILNITFAMKGKRPSVKSNFGVLIDGKEFFCLERYDGFGSHVNLFYDGYKNPTTKQKNKDLGGAHLHTYSTRVLASLYSALLEQGYQPEAIIKSNALKRLEATFYETYTNHNLGYRKLTERYQINQRQINNHMEHSVEQVYATLSGIPIVEKKISEKPAIIPTTEPTQQVQQTFNHTENIEPTPTHKKFYFQDQKEAQKEDWVKE